jgi:hypothetical protein
MSCECIQCVPPMWLAGMSQWYVMQLPGATTRIGLSALPFPEMWIPCVCKLVVVHAARFRIVSRYWFPGTTRIMSAAK